MFASHICLKMKIKISASLGLGGRDYIEDFVQVKVLKSTDRAQIKYVYLGVFDGHGGFHAAQYAKENLLHEITRRSRFWSTNDSDVLAAIKEGFLSTNNRMREVADSWPKTVFGRPSTSGTTATAVFIRNGRVFVGYVGDSSAVCGIFNHLSEQKDVIADLMTKEVSDIRP